MPAPGDGCAFRLSPAPTISEARDPASSQRASWRRRKWCWSGQADTGRFFLLTTTPGQRPLHGTATPETSPQEQDDGGPSSSAAHRNHSRAAAGAEERTPESGAAAVRSGREVARARPEGLTERWRCLARRRPPGHRAKPWEGPTDIGLTPIFGIDPATASLRRLGDPAATPARPVPRDSAALVGPGAASRHRRDRPRARHGRPHRFRAMPGGRLPDSLDGRWRLTEP